MKHIFDFVCGTCPLCISLHLVENKDDFKNKIKHGVGSVMVWAFSAASRRTLHGPCMVDNPSVWLNGVDSVKKSRQHLHTVM